jgi:hypothetical protein
VGRLVRAANRAVRALRWAEAALWAGAAGFLVCAAVVATGDGELPRDGIALAVALALATFATVARATLPTLEETVRDLDRRHQRRWALVAAFEREERAAADGRRGAGSEAQRQLDALLSERARADLDLGDALVGHGPTAVSAAVAPLVAVALLGLAIGPTSRPEAQVGTLTQSAASDLGRALARSADDLGADQRDALARLVRDIERAARTMDLVHEDAAADQLEDLREALAEQSHAVDPTGELAQALERAIERLAAAERRARALDEPELAATDPPAATETDAATSAGSDQPRTGDGVGESSARPGSTATSIGSEPGSATGPADPSAGAGSSGVASTSATDGTGPNAGPEPVSEAAGVRVGWLEGPERALVEAWVEERRRAALDAATSPD